VTGSLNSDPRFDVPITPIREIQENLPTNAMIRVDGTVRSHEQGKWLTLWDESGQVMIQSRKSNHCGSEITSKPLVTPMLWRYSNVCAAVCIGCRPPPIARPQPVPSHPGSHRCDWPNASAT